MQYMCSIKIEQTKDDAIITMKHYCCNCGGTHIYIISCDKELAPIVASCVMLDSYKVDWSDETGFVEMIRDYQLLFSDINSAYKDCKRSYKEHNGETR